MFSAPRYVPALLLLAGLVATPGCASGGYYAYQRSDDYRYAERRAYDNGYREGVDHGEKDARRGRGFSFERHDDWRDADEGYRRGDGDREFYRRVFRRGFEAGYTEAFNRYGRAYGGYPTYPTYPTYGYPQVVPSIGYASPAAQIGFRDGVEAGRNDARDGDRYDPIRPRRYRSADHDYDRRYGSLDDFKRAYREAFQRGYDQGYRQDRQ